MGKATLTALTSFHDAIGDKLEFLDLEIKNHTKTPHLDLSVISINMQELNVRREKLDTNHYGIRAVVPEADLYDHKTEYFDLLGTVRPLQHQLIGIKATFPTTASSSFSTTSSHTQAMKLPKLELQPFYRDYPRTTFLQIWWPN